MRSLPARATGYFQSAVFSAIPRGQRREHVLRDDVWSRIHVLAGALIVVAGRERAGAVVRAGELLDVEPGVPHHLEPLGPDVSFVVNLYRLSAEGLCDRALRAAHARWENEGGRPRP